MSNGESAGGRGYYEMLADDRRSISYRPRLNEMTGGVLATIFLQQAAYWFRKNGDQPFYKFKKPCSHDAYNNGDSWCEELGFSRREFDRARRAIAAKVTKGADRQQIFRDHLVIYWIDGSRKTWYELNVERLCNELSALHP